ncbi:MAG TPA: hypothetical protein VM681_11070, partial [Candidatus Thermoplasmatota archaeon]|nr:hypothetical protein [Candidatus Thermoplasmatota archaeon]
MRRAAAAWAILLLLAVPAAGAQDAGPLLVETLDGESYEKTIGPGGVADFRWWIVNRGTTRLVVLADTTLPGLDWNATVLPSSFVLEPEQATELLFRVQSPQVLESTRAAASVALRAVEEGAVHAPVVLRVGLVVEGNPLVLGFFENPLPPPLDGSMGAFLLTFGFWVLFAAMTIAFQEPILKWFTRHASRRASLRIVQMLRVPVFVGVLFYGFRQSFETLPPVGYVGLAIRIVDAALILVWVYVIYKLFRAALAIALVFAKRTETTMDDIVLPILGKVGAVIIVL